MATVAVRKLTRDKLAMFLPTPELIRAFEQLQDAAAASGSVASFSAVGSVDIAALVTDPTANPILTLGLLPTGVVPGAYTSANLTVDANGRITVISNGAGGGGMSFGLFVNQTSNPIFP